MSEYKRIKDYCSSDTAMDKDCMISIINSYVKELKQNLHEENHTHESFDKEYKYLMQYIKISDLFAKKARESKERYLYNAGYFSALVEEYRLLLDNIIRANRFESVYMELKGRKYYLELLNLLYREDNLQNKKISENLGIKPNQLNPILNTLEKKNCIVIYSYSKYKFYSLSQDFRKYLNSISFVRYDKSNKLDNPIKEYIYKSVNNQKTSEKCKDLANFYEQLENEKKEKEIFEIYHFSDRASIRRNHSEKIYGEA